MNNSLQFAVYKGIGGKYGALQFNLQPPHYYRGKEKSHDGKDSNGQSIFESENSWKLKDGWKIREGAVFLEITSATGPNVYDWDNKIILALSVIDIGKVLMKLLTGEKCEIMHDPGAKSQSQGTVKKFLNIISPDGPSVGVVFTATQISGGEKRTHTVTMSGSEVIILKNLFDRAIARTLNW